MTELALDPPLPPELTGTGHTWITRYRTYPVFSRPWARGRIRSWSAWIALSFVLVTLSLVLTKGDANFPYAGLLHFLIGFMLPMVAGPLLGAWVRRQGWDSKREWAGLVAAVTVAVAATWGFSHFVAEPMKQKLSEALGDVDAKGVRKKVEVSVGVSVSSPDKAESAAAAASGASAPETDEHDGPAAKALSFTMSSLLAFWLAGGWALWGYWSERAALQRLAQARELEQAQAQRREAEMRLSVLAAQVEPHFLFNTLAGVRSAIATDPGRASEMIDRLVDYLRASIPRLRADGALDATLGGQLETVRAYLGLMRARMPRLQVEVEAPPALLGVRCPPLMLISLAENAVKHGAEPKIGPVRITVRAERLDGERLSVTVADDGVGFGGGSSGSGLGLTNLRERLARLNPGRAELTLKARAEGGVAATIILPLEWPDGAPP